MGLRLMCVAAHPDDECFAFGGALALAAERGVETYVVCFTDGQAATNRGEAVSGEELGRIRREEFAASCEVLGVAKHELMEYHDGRLEFADFSAAAQGLVERVRAFRPQVMLTFGLDGGLNTHPDHTMVAAFATAAFHWAGRERRYPEAGAVYQPQRLYYLSTDFFLPERQAPLPIPWTVELDIRGVMERKKRAFREHVSQAPLMEQTRGLFEEHGQSEFYTLAAVGGTQAARVMRDLFEGVVE